MTTRRATLRAQYPELIDGVPPEIRDQLDDDELTARLSHARHLTNAAQGLSTNEAQGHLDLRYRVLAAMPSAELHRQVRAIHDSADGMSTPADASAHRSTAHQLIADHPQAPGFEYGAKPKSRPAQSNSGGSSKAAGRPKPVTADGVIYKGAGSRNDRWYKREFARLELEEKTESYEKTADQLVYSDRELSDTYKKMAAECRAKLARGEY